MGRSKKINVFVVDDNLDTEKSNLEDAESKGFCFSGIKEFNLTLVINEIKKLKDCTILLLDIQDSINNNDQAGIDLYKELGKNHDWTNMKGSVQIVFFSNADTVANLYKAIISEKKIEQLYLSGYLGKEELYSGNDKAIGVLRNADSRAKHYKKYPALADTIINKCELLHHPDNDTMKKLIEKAYLAGKCHETVLILGETGTGKELLAKFIGIVTKEKGFPIGGTNFLSLNIGAQPTSGNLQYTELFGASKEAFSGCTNNRTGLFEHATEGQGQEPKAGATIFLDEIGDAHETIQTALLRVIQEDEIIPLGGFNTKEQKVTKKVVFRLITATNVDIQKKIKSKEFRLDLYHRISTIEISIPPLRKRKSDIPVLAYHFVEKMNKEYNKDAKPEENKYFTEEEIKNFEKELENYDWPGNIRELEKIIRLLFVMSPEKKLEINNIRDVLANMISGSATGSALTPEQIYDDLKKNPCALPELKKKHSIPDLVKVVNLFIKEHGNLTEKNNKESVAIFKRKSDTVRGWYSKNKNWI